jgi:uncharacterized membrane protein (DUF4010 family)
VRNGLRDLWIIVVLCVPIGIAVHIAPRMHLYVGWPVALVCLFVFLKARNIIQNWLLKKLTAEAALKEQQDKISN